MNPLRQLMDILDPRRSDQRRMPRRGAVGMKCSAGQIIDFSMTGMRLRCRRAWAVGETVEMTLQGRPVRVTLRATGVWSRREGWRNHVAGVTFAQMDSQQRATLLQLVDRHGAKGDYALTAA